MPNHSESLQELANNYLKMAKQSSDQTERARFLDYASLYAQLAEEAKSTTSRPAAA